MNFKLTKNIYIAIKVIIWLLYILYATYSFVYLNSFDLKISVLLSGVLIELTIISFINHWHKYGQPYLIDWFRLATFVTIVLDFLSMSSTLDNNKSIVVNDVVMVNTAQAFPTLVAVLIGLISLRFGEMLVFAYKQYNKDPKNYYKKSKLSIRFRNQSFFLLFALFLIALQIFLMIKGIVGYGTYNEHTTASYSFLLQSINIMGPFVLGIFAIIRYKYNYSESLFNVTFLTYFLMQIVLGFLSGMKEDIISPIIIVMVPYLLGGRKIPLQLVAGSFVFFVLLYPINNNYRHLTNENSNRDKITFLKLAISETFKGNFTENFVDGTKSYQGRLSLFPLFMYSVENEEYWSEYKHLDRYIFLPVAWIIPRFILDNKPTSDTGRKLYTMTAGKDTSSITPSTYGWSYMEGGYIPLFFSFLLLGVFITFVQTKLNMDTLFGLLLFIVILVSLLKVESDVYFKISEILQGIFIGFIMYKLFFKVNKKRSKQHISTQIW